MSIEKAHNVVLESSNDQTIFVSKNIKEKFKPKNNSLKDTFEYREGWKLDEYIFNEVYIPSTRQQPLDYHKGLRRNILVNMVETSYSDSIADTRKLAIKKRTIIRPPKNLTLRLF